MSCPTCGGTLATLVIAERMRYSTCGRCGTVVVVDLDREEAEWDIGQRRIYVPKLVERCREFESLLWNAPPTWPGRAEWHRLGLRESINTPGRPPL